MAENFRGHGFVYWEEMLSPDGQFRVLKGYSDGEKTPTLMEPRFIEVSSGKVIADLWHTYLNYEVAFTGVGEVRLRIQDSYKTKSRVAVLDLVTKTFTFADDPEHRETLSKLRERVGLT